MNSDEMLETMKATGTRHEGQKTDNDRMEQALGRRRLDEAVKFSRSMLHFFGESIHAEGYGRWEGYFATALLSVNVREGDTTKTFDHTAAGAMEWHKAKNPGGAALGVVAPNLHRNAEKGAAFAQSLLEWFESNVGLSGIDRWQGHFAVALLTVELRGSCPVDVGGAALFDDAAEAAWKYFDKAVKTV